MDAGLYGTILGGMMGYGDWIMATAQVKQINERTGERVYVIGRGGRPMWSDVFENNPRISRHPMNAHVLQNGPGFRPYIKAKTHERWVWQKWDKALGEIFLTQQEMNFANNYAGRILIEPTTKVENGNKAWPRERWQRLVDSFPESSFIQVGNAVSGTFVGVPFVQTTFRQALAILARSKAFIGTEGGLHHGAAAQGIPAVVLFSEFISPEITGYEGHRNIRHAEGACGARLPCEGCRVSMRAISVEEVITNLKEILQ